MRRKIAWLLIPAILTSGMGLAQAERREGRTGEHQRAQRGLDIDLRRLSVLLDKNDFKESRKLIDDLRKVAPDNPELLYQRVRYRLKNKGYVLTKDSLVGYRYKRDVYRAAVRDLKRLIARKPTHHKAWSLLLHLYAVQQEFQKAADILNESRALNGDNPWQPFDEAIYYAMKKDYRKASGLLRGLTTRHPPSSDLARYNVYRSAWGLWKRIGNVAPAFDPNESVRQGLVKRVLYADLWDDLKKRGEKPVFVHVGSDDSWCLYCVQNQPRIAALARKYGQKMDFVYVSFEPWTAASKTNLPTRWTGLPHEEIYYRNHLISFVSGLQTDTKYRWFVELALDKIEAENLERFDGSDTMKAEALLGWGAEQSLFYYLTLPGKKAYAVLVGAKPRQAVRIFSFYAKGKPSQKAADRNVMRECEEFRAKNQVNGECELFAEGERFVYKGTHVNEKVMAQLRSDMRRLHEKAERWKAARRRAGSASPDS